MFLSTNTDYNLVSITQATNKGGEYLQIFEINASDINYADEVLQNGTLRKRINRKDVEGD